ncbi:penicillin-binding protein 2 [Patescibacteria group bacterium]|nr:MAG: penicillin-binding protein 2 [Patescibacteria group bacterium]
MSRKAKEPIFGFGGEQSPHKGDPVIKRDQGGNERWIEAILPADAEAGVIETPTSRRRLIIIVGAVFLVMAVLAIQMFRLQIIDGDRNLGLADGNRLRQKVTRAPRGVIYDRNKVTLAQNLASFDVTVIPSLLPRDINHRRQIYATVGASLGVSGQEIEQRVERSCIDQALKAGTPQFRAEFDCLAATQPRLVADNVPRETALDFDQLSATTPGFSLDVNPIRDYRDQTLLSAILGYTGRVSEQDLIRNPDYAPTDYAGKLGVELQYEKELRGQNGREQTEVDASGRPIKLLSSQPSVPGSNLVLTIDTELQQQMTEAIKKQMQASGSPRASGIALNPKTGEILAAVNLPSYDNNLFAKGIGQSDYSRLLNDSAQPLFNKAMGGAYPVGSIIKPLIGSAGLQEGVISPSTTVNDTGSLEVPNRYDPNTKYTFRSYEEGGLGVVNISRAIAVSSNVFFYTVGGGFGNIAGLGVDRLTAYYNKFGLGAKTGVDLPGETAGLVPTPASKKKASGEGWYLGDTYNISVGQGDLRASPLQMAVATAAVANGGNVLKPHILKEVQDAGGRTIRASSTEVVRQNFISPANIQLIRQAMRKVVSESYGTACCQMEREVPVPVAGKTGTAETDPNGKRKPHAWFTAFAPYDDPQIVTVILVENSGEGAQYAAPATRETLAWCFKRPGGCVK